MTVTIFDIKRDKELIAAGTHFWCEGCVTARPKDEQSPDPRYCHGCHDFLLKEAKTLNIRARWVPKLKKDGEETPPGRSQSAPQNSPEPEKQGTQFQDNQSPVPADQQVIMSTPAAPVKEVDIIVPPVKVIGAKRGPKHKILPEDRIRRWGKKMSSKAIATKLREELGIYVSYKTIQRILNGKRQLSFPI